MNFVQIADVHFDTPFRALANRADLGQKRRLEQRNAFKKVIDFVKKNNVENLFICGDLYENEYIRRSTIEFINNEFKEIPDTKIIIAPGNHDPLIKNSYYDIYEWNKNVTILDSKVRKIELDNVDIYGYGFTDFELRSNQIYNENLNTQKFNILLTHGDLYNDSIYNSINLNELKKKGFDYIAIGHIHKRDSYYSGSLISLGFDEQGEHGFIYGKIEEKQLTRSFIKADDRELIIKEIDVSEAKSEEDVIDALNNVRTENNFYEIKLIGQKSIPIHIDLRNIQENIIKIKDETAFKIDLREKINEKTLTGFFVKNLEEKLETGEITRKQYQDITELGSRIFKS